MKFFSMLYGRVIGWSRHRHAPYYLGGLSFAESSFFPIPPDVMLAPMALANPQKAWHYAMLTTVMSLLGGVLGYLIGVFAFDLVEPWIRQTGYWDAYQRTGTWFETWGFWAILLVGFSPIPYKVFTISAGVIGMPVVPFILASAIGRGARFFLVAGLMRWGGERMEKALRDYIDRVGWILILFVIIIYLIVNNSANT
ncbi:MAG: YqaA family protein [Pseudomonadota bacterium]